MRRPLAIRNTTSSERRHPWRSGAAVALVSLAAACTSDGPVGPTPAGSARAFSAAVLPAASYTATVYKPQGGFRVVNRNNLIVGTAGDNAVAMTLGAGSLTMLPKGSGATSRAEAVNLANEIVGAVNVASVAQPSEAPAYWARVNLPPVLLKRPGLAADINDQATVVGTFYLPQGTGEAFVWTPRNGVVAKLPPLRGGSNTSAVAINNEGTILGKSDDGAFGWWTVLWRRQGAGWVVSPVQSIDGTDIDAGQGVVGSTMHYASYGNPDFTGYFAMSSLGRSFATAVTERGMVTGWDEGVLAPGAPHQYGWGTAFVADRSGATTYLPYPAGGWLYSYGFGINECGVVVGEVWTQTRWYPAVWDPGC